MTLTLMTPLRSLSRHSGVWRRRRTNAFSSLRERMSLGLSLMLTVPPQASSRPERPIDAAVGRVGALSGGGEKRRKFVRRMSGCQGECAVECGMRSPECVSWDQAGRRRDAPRELRTSRGRRSSRRTGGPGRRSRRKIAKRPASSRRRRTGAIPRNARLRTDAAARYAVPATPKK